MFIEIYPQVTLRWYQNIVLPSQAHYWPGLLQAEIKSRHIFQKESTKKPLFVVVLDSI